MVVLDKALVVVLEHLFDANDLPDFDKRFKTSL